MKGREDDNIDTIRKRFKVFLESSLPVIEYYNSKEKVRKVILSLFCPEKFNTCFWGSKVQLFNNLLNWLSGNFSSQPNPWGSVNSNQCTIIGVSLYILQYQANIKIKLNNFTLYFLACLIFIEFLIQKSMLLLISESIKFKV